MIITLSKDTASSSTATKASEKTSATIQTHHHAMTDDGNGRFLGNPALGLIDYATGAFTVKVEEDYDATSFKTSYENATTFEETIAGSGTGANAPGTTQNSGDSRGGEYGSTTVAETLDGNAVKVTYRPQGSSPTPASESIALPGPVIDLTPYTTDRVVPGSVKFTWMGHAYTDFEGKIYRDAGNGSPGFLAGALDYGTGLAAMTGYVVGPGGFSLVSLWTTKGNWTAGTLFFRTVGSPVKPGGFALSVLDVKGNPLTATANLGGDVSGAHVGGKIDYDTGAVQLMFGDWVLDSSLTDAQKLEWWYNPLDIDVAGRIWRPWPVDPSTARYNVVFYALLPLSADILGLDPVRLPPDGRVPIFRPGDVAVVHNTATATLPNPVPAGYVLDLGRTRLAYAHVSDAVGQPVPSSKYTADLDHGTLAMASPLDLTGYAQPLSVEHRIEDMLMVSDVRIDGTLAFTRQLTHDFPANTTYVSSALVVGDLQARATGLFDQQTWDGTWQDTVKGSPAGAGYNDTLYPVAVANAGAIQERWALVFTSSTTFDCYGEYSGLIAVGNVAADFAPVNPIVSQPYFTLNSRGWGAGWSAGNVLRFDTLGANHPLWLARTTLQSDPADFTDGFKLQIRGDAN